MPLSGPPPLIVAYRPPLVTHHDGRRPLFPERQEDTYRGLLLRRVSAANALLLTKIEPVLRRLAEDINARARRDTMSEDLSILLRVIGEAEEAFERRNEPKAADVEVVGAQVDRFAAAQVARALRRVVGLDVTRGGLLTEAIQGWSAENVKLIKTIDSRFFDDIRKVTTEALRTGRSTRDLIKEFQARYSVSKSRAEVIARDQIGTLNSKLTQDRQTSLGVTKYRWRTLRDERVRGRPGGKYPDARPSHWAREGQEYEWAKPPRESDDDGHPGEPIQCRCTAEPVLPGS